MFKFTLILPADDNDAARLLREAINDLQVILLIVIGPNEDWARMADQLAARGQGDGISGSFRRVVWIKQPGSQVLEVLRGLADGQATPDTGVVALNFHDKVCDVVPPNEIRPLRLEEAFLKGQL